MPGMITGLNIDDPAVVAAFRSALVHQGFIALVNSVCRFWHFN